MSLLLGCAVGPAAIMCVDTRLVLRSPIGQWEPSDAGAVQMELGDGSTWSVPEQRRKVRRYPWGLVGTTCKSHPLITLIFDQLGAEDISAPEDIVHIIADLPKLWGEGARFGYSSLDARDDARVVFLYNDDGTFHLGDCTLGGQGTIQWDSGFVILLPRDMPASVARKAGEAVGPALALSRDDSGIFEVLRQLAGIHFMVSSASQRVSDTMDLLILAHRPHHGVPSLRELRLHGKSSVIRSASDAWIGERMRPT